ncbi:MAG: anti-sigma factor antagonist [Solirubrobacteraceae bacterium]|nr:anti-sigma factor antagonist [Solirubrobacteraceae bacterium]
MCPSTRTGVSLRASIARVLNFDLQSETRDENVLVRIRGDFDVQVAARATDALTELEARAPSSLVIDLRDVSFMDSSGMAVIASAHARATAVGRRFAVVAPPAGVRHAFEVSGLADVVPVVEDLARVYPDWIA